MIERVIGMLKIGGRWGSSFGLYVRTGANEVTLVEKFDDDHSEEDRERTKKAIKMCGFDYVDKSEG